MRTHHFVLTVSAFALTAALNAPSAMDRAQSPNSSDSGDSGYSTLGAAAAAVQAQQGGGVSSSSAATTTTTTTTTPTASVPGPSLYMSSPATRSVASVSGNTFSPAVNSAAQSLAPSRPVAPPQSVSSSTSYSHPTLVSERRATPTGVPTTSTAQTSSTSSSSTRRPAPAALVDAALRSRSVERSRGGDLQQQTALAEKERQQSVQRTQTPAAQSSLARPSAPTTSSTAQPPQPSLSASRSITASGGDSTLSRSKSATRPPQQTPTSSTALPLKSLAAAPSTSSVSASSPTVKPRAASARRDPTRLYEMQQEFNARQQALRTSTGASSSLSSSVRQPAQVVAPPPQQQQRLNPTSTPVIPSIVPSTASVRQPAQVVAPPPQQQQRLNPTSTPVIPSIVPSTASVRTSSAASTQQQPQQLPARTVQAPPSAIPLFASLHPTGTQLHQPVSQRPVVPSSTVASDKEQRIQQLTREKAQVVEARMQAATRLRQSEFEARQIKDSIQQIGTEDSELRQELGIIEKRADSAVSDADREVRKQEERIRSINNELMSLGTSVPAQVMASPPPAQPSAPPPPPPVLVQPQQQHMMPAPVVTEPPKPVAAQQLQPRLIVAPTTSATTTTTTASMRMSVPAAASSSAAGGSSELQQARARFNELAAAADQIVSKRSTQKPYTPEELRNAKESIEKLNRAITELTQKIAESGTPRVGESVENDRTDTGRLAQMQGFLARYQKTAENAEAFFRISQQTKEAYDKVQRLEAAQSQKAQEVRREVAQLSRAVQKTDEERRAAKKELLSQKSLETARQEIEKTQAAIAKLRAQAEAESRAGELDSARAGASAVVRLEAAEKLLARWKTSEAASATYLANKAKLEAAQRELEMIEGGSSSASMTTSMTAPVVAAPAPNTRAADEAAAREREREELRRQEELRVRQAPPSIIAHRELDDDSLLSDMPPPTAYERARMELFGARDLLANIEFDGKNYASLTQAQREVVDQQPQVSELYARYAVLADERVHQHVEPAFPLTVSAAPPAQVMPFGRQSIASDEDSEYDDDSASQASVVLPSLPATGSRFSHVTYPGEADEYRVPMRRTPESHDSEESLLVAPRPYVQRQMVSVSGRSALVPMPVVESVETRSIAREWVGQLKGNQATTLRETAQYVAAPGGRSLSDAKALYNALLHHHRALMAPYAQSGIPHGASQLLDEEDGLIHAREQIQGVLDRAGVERPCGEGEDQRSCNGEYII